MQLVCAYSYSFQQSVDDYHFRWNQRQTTMISLQKNFILIMFGEPGGCYYQYSLSNIVAMVNSAGEGQPTLPITQNMPETS